MSSSNVSRSSDIPEPTSPRARAYRRGSPSLALPLLATAVVAVLAVALLILIPQTGTAPETLDATTEPAPGAGVPTNNVEGQGAEPENSGGVLEPGLLPDVDTPIGTPTDEPADTTRD